MPWARRFEHTSLIAGLLLMASAACSSNDDTEADSSSSGATSAGGTGTGATASLGTGGVGTGGVGNATGSGGEGNAGEGNAGEGNGGSGNAPTTGGTTLGGSGGGGIGPATGGFGPGGTGGAGNAAGTGGAGNAAGTGGAGNAAGTGGAGNDAGTGGAAETGGVGGAGGVTGTGGMGNDTGTGGGGNEGGNEGGSSTGHVRDPSLPTYPFSDPEAKYPFPQMVKYPHGVQSANVDYEFVASWYENWKSRYLKDCNGAIMPSTDNSTTAKVEAEGFGMIAAAYMADKTTVDGLYAFYQSKVQASSCGLMAWLCNCGGVQDGGAATDGDIDVASGLIVAHWQWPDDGYDEKARGVIGNLSRVLVDCSGNLKAVRPGCGWGGCDETDISYYSPAFFRYFAQISGDDVWNKLADDTHTIRDNAANASTGLVPDWQSVEGRAGSGSRVGDYGFDAIRTPFKQALDYLWNGNEPARAWCEKITTWASGVGAGNVVDGYRLDGSPIGRNHNLAVVGSLAVCASANTQEVVDAFVAESAKQRDDFWYSGYLGNLYLLAMSGNMWNRDMMAD